MNGMRNGFGVMRSLGGSTKMKAYWKDNNPIGTLILEKPSNYTCILRFKDGIPAGDFCYYFPFSFVSIKGQAKFLAGKINVKA